MPNPAEAYEAGTVQRDEQLAAKDAEIAALRAHLESIMVGGNHLASALIGMLGAGETFPGYLTDPDVARANIKDVDRYDCWVCWSTIMKVRDAIRPEDRQQFSAEPKYEHSVDWVPPQDEGFDPEPWECKHPDCACHQTQAAASD